MQRLDARVDRDVIEIETVDFPPSVPGVEIEDLRNRYCGQESSAVCIGYPRSFCYDPLRGAEQRWIGFT